MWLLMLAPLLLASCSDDDDKASDVRFSVDFANCVGVDGVLYTVQGQDLEFTAIKAYTTDGVAVAISGVDYYWDGIPAGGTIVEPFGASFDTSLYSVGDHFVKIRIGVYENNQAPTFSVITVPVVIVADAADLPGEVVNGTIAPQASSQQ